MLCVAIIQEKDAGILQIQGDILAADGFGIAKSHLVFL